MSGITVNRTAQNISAQQRLTSQPKEASGWSKFGKIVGDVANGVVGLSPLLGQSLGGLGANSGLDQQYELIQLQREIQQQTQMFSTISNVSKSKHDAAMSAVRNFK